MRSLKKNKQKLYYATYSDEIPVYETDEDGKIKYTEDDGEPVPIQMGIMAGYNKPVIFYANIARSGGEVEAKEYGFDIGSYQAILSKMLRMERPGMIRQTGSILPKVMMERQWMWQIQRLHLWIQRPGKILSAGKRYLQFLAK